MRLDRPITLPIRPGGIFTASGYGPATWSPFYADKTRALRKVQAERDYNADAAMAGIGSLNPPLGDSGGYGAFDEYGDTSALRTKLERADGRLHKAIGRFSGDRLQRATELDGRIHRHLGTTPQNATEFTSWMQTAGALVKEVNKITPDWGLIAGVFMGAGVLAIGAWYLMGSGK